MLDLQSHTQRVDKPFWFQRREVSYSVVSTSASKVFSWYECSLTWAQDSVGTPISSMEGLAQFSRALPLKLTSHDLYQLQKVRVQDEKVCMQDQVGGLIRKSQRRYKTTPTCSSFKLQNILRESLPCGHPEDGTSSKESAVHSVWKQTRNIGICKISKW